MTPKDARRRLLRKLQGPLEHYIPVLMNHRRREKLSRGKRVKLAKDYGKRPHRIDEDFRYVTFKFNLENDKHKRVLNLLKTKRKLKGKFVYSIYERDTGLVVNGQMEDALRDGDICDLMISDFSDKVLVRYRNGDKVMVPLEDWDGQMAFLEGEGATTKEVEDKHHYGKATMGLAQIYEMKEKGADEEELERLRNASLKKAKMAQLEIDPDVIVKKEMKIVLDNLDYADDLDDEYEKEMKKFQKLKEDLEKEKKEVEEEEKALQEESKEETAEDETASEAPSESTVSDQELEDQIPEENTQMTVKDMGKTENVGEKLVEGGVHVIKRLPLISEINDIVKNMGEGKKENLADVSGVSVRVGEVDKFLVGQMVETAQGEVFVPGQTVETDFGTRYMPGITVNIDDTPTLVAGLIMANDYGEGVFLPGQAVITDDGQLKLGQEDEPIKPSGMQQMDIELDVNEVNAEDEERKIAKRLQEEEERREKEEKERQEREKKRLEEERKEREKIAKEKKDREDREWAKLGAVERAKKERLRIDREKRELEKQRKEELEREKQEKERQEKEAIERAQLRKEREEVERKRMERLREEKKQRLREAAKKKAEKEEQDKKREEEAKKEAEQKVAAQKRAKLEEEHEKRLKELAEFVPKEIKRKEVVVDVAVEQSDEAIKKSFLKEERARMQRIRAIKIRPRPKIVIPVIPKYEPYPPVIISEKLKEMQALIHSGTFLADHKKFLPNKLTLRLKIRFHNNFSFRDIKEFKSEFKRKYLTKIR